MPCRVARLPWQAPAASRLFEGAGQPGHKKLTIAIHDPCPNDMLPQYKYLHDVPECLILKNCPTPPGLPIPVANKIQNAIQYKERSPDWWCLAYTMTSARAWGHSSQLLTAEIFNTAEWRWFWHANKIYGIITPPCVAESDQRHAQHPLKMLGIDFSCGSYQTNSERIMLLNSWYQIDMSLYSNRYLFVRSKIGGRKWQPHILCKTMSFLRFPTDAMVRLATTRTCTEDDTRRYANIILIVIPVSSPQRPQQGARSLWKMHCSGQ